MSALELERNRAIEGTKTATKLVVFLEKGSVRLFLRRDRDGVWIETQKVFLPDAQFEP